MSHHVARIGSRIGSVHHTVYAVCDRAPPPDVQLFVPEVVCRSVPTLTHIAQCVLFHVAGAAHALESAPCIVHTGGLYHMVTVSRMDVAPRPCHSRASFGALLHPRAVRADAPYVLSVYICLYPACDHRCHGSYPPTLVTCRNNRPVAGGVIAW